MGGDGKDPNKKHRHDIGAVDHGAVHTERTTKTIQGVLIVSILASTALVAYAILLAAGV